MLLGLSDVPVVLKENSFHNRNKDLEVITFPLVSGYHKWLRKKNELALYSSCADVQYI